MLYWKKSQTKSLSIHRNTVGFLEVSFNFNNLIQFMYVAKQRYTNMLFIRKTLRKCKILGARVLIASLAHFHIFEKLYIAQHVLHVLQNTIMYYQILLLYVFFVQNVVVFLTCIMQSYPPHLAFSLQATTCTHVRCNRNFHLADFRNMMWV